MGAQQPFSKTEKENFEQISGHIFQEVDKLPENGHNNVRNEKEMIHVGRYLIYGLLDPRDASLRYIGKTHKRREWRLAEHLDHAREGDKRPVYDWIRELIQSELAPEIFIWRRVPPNENWRLAEKQAIEFWSRPENIAFPYIHPPQTPKSTTVTIRRVKLENATMGG